jgi:hypothetical protein
MRDLIHSSLGYQVGNRSSYQVTQNESDSQAVLANDVVNALAELKFLHPRIEEITYRLTSYLGFDIRYGYVSLVDSLLTDAYSSFLIAYKVSGVSNAYQEFICRLAKGLESALDFSVMEEESQDTWIQCIESYTEFRSRHPGKVLSIQYSEDMDRFIKEDYVFSILPFVLTRKDMVSLSMPVAGFDVVIRGNSMIKDNAL